MTFLYNRLKIATVYYVKANARDGSMRGEHCSLLYLWHCLTSFSRCMGFHSGTDNKLPEKFICFDCRVRADQNWDLIMVHDLHPRMMAKFRDLALLR